MSSEGAGGLSTAALEMALASLEDRYSFFGPAGEARAELAALVAEVGRAATLAAENAALREAVAEFGRRLREIEGTTAVLQRAHAAQADPGPGAAGARDETAVVAAARAVWDTWRAFEAALLTRDWAGHDKCKGDYYAALDALGAALDAPRAGGTGETETGG